MMHQDPISDMLTRIRNALRGRRRFVELSLSRQKHDILKVLEQQGFIGHILVDEQHKKMRIFMKYSNERTPLIKGLKRISKPGLRRYVNKHEIPKVSGSLGIAVVSTSQGIIDGETAREKGIGGEFLCYVW